MGYLLVFFYLDYSVGRDDLLRETCLVGKDGFSLVLFMLYIMLSHLNPQGPDMLFMATARVRIIHVSRFEEVSVSII